MSENSAEMEFLAPSPVKGTFKKSEGSTSFADIVRESFKKISLTTSEKVGWEMKRPT